MRPSFFYSLALLCHLALALTSVQAEKGEWREDEFATSNIFTFIPKGFLEKGKEERSLLINLHGCAQKAKDLKEGAGWDAPSLEHNTLIVIPDVPNGGKYTGCWNYYGKDHTRLNKDNQFILNLTAKWIKDYQINPHQVFIAGLSSGSALAFVLSCLAPEVYAGVGLNSGPSVGTGVFEISRARQNVDDIVENCRSLAKDKSAHFGNQIVSVISGDYDWVVDNRYSQISADAYAKMFQTTSKVEFDTSTLAGSNSEGKGIHYLLNGKVVISLIENKGLGHNWPGGQGGTSGSFINQDSIDYARYLLDFFHSNNRRP